MVKNMKKKIFIILGVIIILCLITYGIIVFIDYNNVSNGKVPFFAKKIDNENFDGIGYNIKVKYYNDTEKIETIDMFLFGRHIAGTIIDYADFEEKDISDNIKEDSIIIENNKIKNEELLDNFIENANNKQPAILELNIITDEKLSSIRLEYVPGKNYENVNLKASYENEEIIMTAPDKNWTFEDYQKYYGYYILTKNGAKEKYDDYHFKIKRQVTENIVTVYFNAELLDLTEIPIICKYDLDSSLYRKIYGDLTYNQRRDLGIEQIAYKNQYDNTDYGFYTIGGDVTITVEDDMIYSLEEALKNKILKVEDIMTQAKLDEKYGICDTAYYMDGGSIEYRYKDYTILKYNTLDGNKDLFIGMNAEFINGSLLNVINEKRLLKILKFYK